MSDEDFKVELESDEHDQLTVRLDGELDIAHASWVDDTLAAAGAHHRRIAVELDALSFLDSSGIRVLQSLAQRAHELGIGISFTKPSPAVQRALRAAEITDLTE